jgi:hypothetical protein
MASRARACAFVALACVVACISGAAADKGFPGFEFGTPLPPSVREREERERFCARLPLAHAALLARLTRRVRLPRQECTVSQRRAAATSPVWTCGREVEQKQRRCLSAVVCVCVYVCVCAGEVPPQRCVVVVVRTAAPG